MYPTTNRFPPPRLEGWDSTDGLVKLWEGDGEGRRITGGISLCPRTSEDRGVVLRKGPPTSRLFHYLG